MKDVELEDEVEESMTDIFKQDIITNFKGIYYTEKENQRFFEGKAHFSYKELFKVLELLYASLPADRKFIETSSHNKVPSSKNVAEIETVTINLFETPNKNVDKTRIPLDKGKTSSCKKLVSENNSNVTKKNEKKFPIQDSVRIRSRSKTSLNQQIKNIPKGTSKDKDKKNSILNLKNPIKIKSVKYNHNINNKVKMPERSSSGFKSFKDSFCSNSSFTKTTTKSSLRNPQLTSKRQSNRTFSSDGRKDGSRLDTNKSQTSTEKNNMNSLNKKLRRNNKSINIENKKIYTTINPNHLKKYNLNSKLTTLNNDITKEVHKLTSDFAFTLMSINNQYINNYLTEAKKDKDMSKSKEKNLNKYEKKVVPSKKDQNNDMVSRNQSSLNITKITSSNSSNTKSTVSKISANKFF